jgi:hypothetical protein
LLDNTPSILPEITTRFDAISEAVVSPPLIARRPGGRRRGGPRGAPRWCGR